MSEFKFIYENEPIRNKITSAGITLAVHNKCGNRCVITYEEDKNYKIYCELCGEVDKIRANSKDDAIYEWARRQNKN